MKNNSQDKFNLEVGKELKILRLKLNLTQSEMANNIISTPTYSKIERGEARISFNDLVSILKVHRIDLYKFVKKINESHVSGNAIESSYLIKLELEKAFYNNDLKTALYLKEEAIKHSDTYIKLLGYLIVAALQHSIDELDEKIKRQIRQIFFKYDEFNKYTLKLFGNAMGIYSVEEMSFQLNVILYKYSDPSRINPETQIIIAGICTNFIYNCYESNHIELISRAVHYLDKLPNIPQLFFYKTLGKYYMALIMKNKDKKNLLEKILVEIGYDNFIYKLKILKKDTNV